jgi:Tol biopolymer transport system component
VVTRQQQLAFTRCDIHAYRGPAAEDDCAIYAISRDGTDLRKLAGKGLLPDWSPDGKHIVFMSTRDRTRTITAGSDTSRYAAELYVMNTDGTQQHRLTRTPRLEEAAPRWSPGGTRIAYQRRGDAYRTRLFEINADGTCPTAITPANDTSWYSLPAWNTRHRAADSPMTCP